MERQKTIKSKFSVEGLGLHTGEKVKLELSPVQENTGIIFVRRDLDPPQLIKANIYAIQNYEKSPRRTTIGKDGVYIQTIEHLMAALSILRIDNLRIDIWGDEIPAMDGSAKYFVDKIKSVGIEEQEALREYVVVKEPLWVEDGDAKVVILPYPKQRVSYTLQYKERPIGTEYLDIVLDGEDVSSDFYQARTFCLEEEAEALLKAGLGKGSNYENTLVVGKNDIVNNKMRIEDEFVKHKVTDLIGDLYLAGPIKGHIIALRSGHRLNMKVLNLLKKYIINRDTKDNIEIGDFSISSEQLDINEIMRIIPHRYPFILVDKIVYLEKGKKARGIKNVTINEYFFPGHFPQKPVMPGVLLIEAMAQVGGVIMLSCIENKSKLAYFMSVNNVKFRLPVQPGDQLLIEVEVLKARQRNGVVAGKIFVDNKLAVEGELTFALVDR